MGSIVEAVDDMLGKEGLAALQTQADEVGKVINFLKLRMENLFAKGEIRVKIVLPALFLSAITDRPHYSNRAMMKASHILKFAPEHIPALNLKSAILLDRCKFDEARPFIDRALAAVKQDTPTEERILAIYGLARIHLANSERPKALSLLKGNLDLALEANLPPTAIGDAHGSVAWAYYSDQEYALAAHHDQEAIKAYKAAGNNLLIARAYTSLSHAHASGRFREDAIEDARKSVEYSKRAGDLETLASKFERLSSTIMDKQIQGSAITAEDLNEAEMAGKDAVEIYKKLGKLDECGHPLMTLSMIAEARQDWEQSIDWMRQIVTECEIDSTNKECLSLYHHRLGRFLELADKCEEADLCYTRAIELIEAKDTGDSDLRLIMLFLLAFGFKVTARELERRSKADRADRVYRYVLETAVGVFPCSDIASVATGYAVFLAKQDRIDEARHQAARAREAARNSDNDSRTRLEQALKDHGL